MYLPPLLIHTVVVYMVDMYNIDEQETIYQYENSSTVKVQTALPPRDNRQPLVLITLHLNAFKTNQVQGRVG